MNRSPSRSDISTTELSGVDLSQYKEELNRERNSRTLTLRRMNRPTLKSVFGNLQQKSRQPISLSDNKQNVINDAVTTLQSGDESAIQSFCQDIINTELVSVSNLAYLAHSPEVAEAMGNAALNPVSENTIVSLLGAISNLFPLSGSNDTAFIDTGIVFSLPEFIENPNLINASVTFIGCISETSSYARDAILCNELHVSLCQIALQSESDELTVNVCEAIRKIFANNAEIDFQILSDSVNPIADLLNLTNLTALHSIIATFTEMACKMSTLVLKYDQIGLYSKVIEFIQNENLTDVTLKLIGVLSIGQPSHVRAMFEGGLFDLLMKLLDTEFCPDVFWIFSNLIETLGGAALQFFDPSFITHVVEISESASFVVKKEAAFFLSTYALFSDPEVLYSFLNEAILDILVEMLGCGVSIIMNRIIDIIVRMVHQLQMGSMTDDFVNLITESDLRKRLEDITEQQSGIVAERAQYLLGLLDSIDN